MLLQIAVELKLGPGFAAYYKTFGNFRTTFSKADLFFPIEVDMSNIAK